MTQQLVIAGSGFAGTWAALAAARAVALAGKEDEVTITMISPAPELHIRPRLYEAAIEGMAPDIAPLLKAVGVHHVAGWVENIETDRQLLHYTTAHGERAVQPYDRFVLAVGSRLFMPDIPGLTEHAFDIDQLETATTLALHLKELAGKPDTPARNTVVIAGGGFTGIEAATEMRQRLWDSLGKHASVRVVLLEQQPEIGPDLGPGPRPVIEEALAACGVEVHTGAGVVSIEPETVVTSSGLRIPTRTVVWTAGARAHPLARQIPGRHDRMGRVHADRYLRAEGVNRVFVTGDVAHAAADDAGNVALMSCQHALSLGRVAGYNAAAELVGLPLHPYSQPKYVTCLDLGAWGAIFTEGWERQIVLRQEEAKSLKRQINTQWIYPPAPDREAAFAIANPDFVIVA